MVHCAETSFVIVMEARLLSEKLSIKRVPL